MSTLVALLACNKVPIHGVEAGFGVADASWFAEEETLFVFWEVSAEQGLGEPSVIELRYATDEERVDWTPVSELGTVHTHLPVDCGVKALCGSTSVAVALEPREVAVRLRYHRDGELALEPDTLFNVVGPGRPHSSRSFVVYGVFDETNQRIQWRGRHQFPTIRNQHAERLGLRRDFEVFDQRYGSADVATDDNLYGYGRACPATFLGADLPRVATDERAVFNGEDLPLQASGASVVCGASTVWDAKGPFVTDAFARKNPEVRPAFPLLRSPVRDATRLGFFLGPCDRVIDADHEEMLRQRLQMEGQPTFCTDDWRGAGFVDELVAEMTNAIEQARPAGQDMVLVIGLYRDEEGLADAVEEALLQVVPEERLRGSPRLAGAFVLDSEIRVLANPELEPATLWCPAGLGTGASALSCAVVPDIPDLELGPLSIGALPILPSRDQYLEFIDTYSKRQAGEVTKLTFLTPEFATTTEHVDLGQFGSITFLNDESISAQADDAFSYCTGEELLPVFFRSEVLASEDFFALIAEDCASGALDPDFCATASVGVLPIQWLPFWHNNVPEARYDLGVYWDFPFLLRLEYQAVVGGAVSAFGLSVPFGLAGDAESTLGSWIWTADEFSLEEELAHCTRFCDEPTFDSAGVYHVTDLFRPTYESSCYRPVHPWPPGTGFPLDP